MARKLRIEYPNALYHVMNRGLDRRELFCDDRDYLAFLEDMEGSVETHAVEVHAYSLLSNHYHLLVRTPRANLSSFMQSLQTRYSVFYNRRHRKSGHVFEGPYRAILVQEGDYLLSLTRYIHLNPVRTKVFKNRPVAEVVRALRGYRWSSYRGHIGLARRMEWMRYDLLDGQVQSRFGSKRGIYRRYVERGLAETDEDVRALLQGRGLALGNAEFLEWVEDRHRELMEGGARRREDTSMKRAGQKVSPATVVRGMCEAVGISEDVFRQRRGGGAYRGLAAKLLIRHAGLTQREAATHLGVTTGAAVSIRIREAEQLLNSDNRWRRRMKKIERRLSRLANP